MRLIAFLATSVLFFHTSQVFDQKPMYMYPVAVYEYLHKPHLLIVYQWSPDHLELYDNDITSGTVTKALMAMYTPAAVCLLPDSSGFSFVDNGRIRIKRFEKRAVKSLNIYDPVYGIELIKWLDNQTCYFHAQYDGHYGIYTLTIEEELTPILTSTLVDYMYPNIVCSDLFFIERSMVNRQWLYQMGKAGNTGTCATNILLTFDDKPRFMLTMKSSHEGYLIESAGGENLHIFNYIRLFETEAGWKTEKLFSFTVPAYLLTDQQRRLYESLLPLAPRVTDSFIFYSSYNENLKHMVIYKYDKRTSQSILIAHGQGDLFAPLFFGLAGWYGGSAKIDCLTSFLPQEIMAHAV